jgi:DICT domain-containing protein
MLSTPSARTGSLSIGGLAAHTGVPPATLRSWEARYGFPRPIRLPGGHRRYSEGDVTAVREVLRHRNSGLALEAAVRRVTFEAPRSRSVYAELRDRHPQLNPLVLSKAAVVALSHAIEDECCARAQEPLLFGGFQRDRFLRASDARWAELARTACATVCFTDGATSTDVRPGQPIEVAIPREAPLNREWFVVCDASDLPACMAAVERPGADTGHDARRFEVVWTVDPRAVRSASRVAVALADQYRPGWRATELDWLDAQPSAPSDDLRRASGLLSRMMGYLDGGD